MPGNFVKYGNFNILNGRCMRSTGPIYLIFKRNRDIIIIHHPTKFNQNRSRTFWDNLGTDSQTHRHTYTHIDTQPRMKIKPLKKNFFGPGKNHMLNMYYRSVIPIILFRMIFCLFCLFDTSLIFVLLCLISQVKYHKNKHVYF